ncbi:MAG: hypothetical protein ABEK36_02245, partial [Candidatus Aenigmatarchaeota archaeon]
GKCFDMEDQKIDNAISSLKISSGYDVNLFSSEGCGSSGGTNRHIDDTLDYLGEESFNDETSSLMVVEEQTYYTTAEKIHDEFDNLACVENPNYFCVFIDGVNNYEREAELEFDISSFLGTTITEAKICGYRYNGQKTRNNYIQDLYSSPSCGNAIGTSSPQSSWVSSSISSSDGWKCIDITDVFQDSIDSGDNKLYLRWWGHDLNGDNDGEATCYRAYTDLSDCGGSNPSGATDCRPFIKIKQ